MSEPASLRVAGRNGRLIGLIAVNTLSTLAQIVQIGTLPPLLSFVLAERGVSPMTIGAFATAPWLMILVVSHWVPWIIRQLGLAAATGGSMVVSALAILAMSQVTSLWILFVLNLLVGFGLIIRWIACDTWIVRLASEANRGRAIGTHETLMGLGIALGPALLSVTGVDSALPFLLCVGLLAAALGPLLVARRWNDRPGVPAGVRAGWRVALLLPTALAGAFVCGFVETASISLLPVYFGALGFATGVAALLVGTFGAGGTILQFPLGWLADILGFRHTQFICAAIVILGTAILPTVLEVSWLPWLLLFIWGGAVGGMNTLAVIEVGARIDEAHTSAAMTLVAMAYTLGSVVGPSVSGTTMENVSVHGVMIAAAAVAGLFFLVAAAGLGRK